MSDDKGGDHGYSITSLTTPYADPDLLSAFEAMWTSPPVAIPFKDLKLKRLYQPPARRRPDRRAKAIYLAAWYQIEGGEKVPNVVAMPADFSDVRTTVTKVVGFSQ